MASDTNTIKYTSTYANPDQLEPPVFKAQLQSDIASTSSKNLNPSSPIWNTLHALVDQAVLNDAHALTAAAINLLHTADPTLILAARASPKSLARFATKASFGSHDKHGNPSDSAWKAVNDFIAMRMPARVPEMTLRQRQASRGRGRQARRKVVCLEDGEDSTSTCASAPKDLCCFVYAWLPAVGSIMEVQVNHPFASFTFARDSLLREHPERKGELVDMWDEGLYGAVGDALRRSEGPEEEDKAAVREKVAKAYETKTKDVAVFEILEAETLL
ncbi:uncharacterized protein BDZ99DRAFT_477416 [Mytilinidion resinicola]|uniref:Uncharacterized protein n=1 Tax=Mytilinidion resinicola TaxID=574789 RepID=A0A6A6YJ87_9PEZI|nr:uncharacterized protein BDZ99DRAFT_477416 [Mytilinidion resinicola]KAF2808916.1 hypothetical protein BDZ99DRAFT_477416 [Mytilinidion resinicola]